MKRGPTGRYEVMTVGGETVRAFVPRPLPPDSSLVLQGPIQRLLERALLAIGRLDSVSTLLPDTDLFLYAYVRKEAVRSSQIEGDAVLAVRPVALRDGAGARRARLRGGFPLSARLIREIHAKVLARGRGSEKDPGEFRRSQNWVGGSRPGTAVFVPPPHTAVPG